MYTLWYLFPLIQSNVFEIRPCWVFQQFALFFFLLLSSVPLAFPCGSAGKESARKAGDLGSIPGLGRSPGEGKGYPLWPGEFRGFSLTHSAFH